MNNSASKSKTASK
jgi:histone H2B